MATETSEMIDPTVAGPIRLLTKPIVHLLARAIAKETYSTPVNRDRRHQQGNKSLHSVVSTWRLKPLLAQGQCHPNRVAEMDILLRHDTRMMLHRLVYPHRHQLHVPRPQRAHTSAVSKLQDHRLYQHHQYRRLSEVRRCIQIVRRKYRTSRPISHQQRLRVHEEVADRLQEHQQDLLRQAEDLHLDLHHLLPINVVAQTGDLQY